MTVAIVLMKIIALQVFIFLLECLKNEKYCEDGKCLSKNFICDGNIDCQSGIDEKDCDKGIIYKIK